MRTNWSRTHASARYGAASNCGTALASMRGCTASCATAGPTKFDGAGSGSDEDIEAVQDSMGVDGERTAEARMTLAAVRKALGSLSADYRAVLVLVCVDGLSYQEAADVLGVAIGTVMSRLARGRRELYAALSGERPGDAPNVHSLLGRSRPQSARGNRDER